MARDGWAGRKSKPPTLVAEATAGVEKPPGPRPSTSELTKMLAAPSPPVFVCHVATTSPDGPTATSPKLPAAPGMAWLLEKLLTNAAPSPVARVPAADTPPVPLR